MNVGHSSAQPPLIPINDCLLIKLEQAYNNFGTKETKYETRTQGIVVAVPQTVTGTYKGDPIYDKTNNYLLNKRVYFEEYKEGARIKRDGELYCFIKLEDIRGYEDVEANT